MLVVLSWLLLVVLVVLSWLLLVVLVVLSWWLLVVLVVRSCLLLLLVLHEVPQEVLRPGFEKGCDFAQNLPDPSEGCGNALFF